MLNQLKIIESDYALEETAVPVRVHRITRQHLNEFEKRINWKGKRIFTYHDRIQKKWIKRWGYIMKPCINKTPEGYIVHPSLAARLRKELKKY